MALRNINIKKILIRLGILVVSFLIIVFLFCIPHLILVCRNSIYSIIKIDHSLVISNNSYIQMMINIFSCCVTTFLGFCTYALTKILRKLEMEKYNARLINSAYRLHRNVSNICWIIFNANSKVANLNKLLDNTDLELEWFDLYSSDKLDDNDIKFLDEFKKRLSGIVKNAKVNIATLDLEKKFCDRYFIDNGCEYSQELQNLLDKLKKIYERKV